MGQNDDENGLELALALRSWTDYSNDLENENEELIDIVRNISSKSLER